MPPRYAYWTILIDNRPTAFRARDREELLPTVAQLRRTNTDVVLKWFARGRIWESREAELAAQHQRRERKERRGPDWRPGGSHQDPRDRFRERPDRRPARPPADGSRESRPPDAGGKTAKSAARRPFRPKGRPFRPARNTQAGPHASGKPPSRNSSGGNRGRSDRRRKG
jgi:hypothetical protein